jgi:DNA-binding phage protein
MIRLADAADWGPALRVMQAAAKVDDNALAAAAGITRPHVANMRWGGYAPSFRTLLLVADALGYDLALIPREDTDV